MRTAQWRASNCDPETEIGITIHEPNTEWRRSQSVAEWECSYRRPTVERRRPTASIRLLLQWVLVAVVVLLLGRLAGEIGPALRSGGVSALDWLHTNWQAGDSNKVMGGQSPCFNSKELLLYSFRRRPTSSAEVILNSYNRTKSTKIFKWVSIRHNFANH